jgi:arylsulfatase A-like enzyme
MPRATATRTSPGAVGVRRAIAVVALLVAVVQGGCDARRSTDEASGASPRSRRLESSADALPRANIDNESRFVLGAPIASFDLTVPPDAALELGFGVLDRGWQHGMQAALLRVTFDANGDTTVLLEETRTKPGKGENRWTDVVLPLARLAGKQGSLRLEGRMTAGSERSRDAIVWTNPTLVVGGGVPQATNLVLISVDTLRADRLGCYGGDRPTSPAIDAMARSGVLFRNAVAASSWTLPSHASMLTALDPSRHGAVSFGFTTSVPPQLETMTERLWSAGYDTAAFTDGFFVSAGLGFDQGFDRFRGPTRLESTARENLERALHWMRARAGRPFFVFVHTYETHMPYAPPPPYDTMFDEGYRGPYARAFTYEDYEALQKSGGDDDPKTIAHLMALYDGEIRHVDDGIGWFLAELETSGLARNTCVVLTSDHGEEFGEHGDLTHNHAKLFQELLHVPLIVWCPSRFAPRQVDELVGHVDLAPTLLEIAGAAPLQDVDGRSVLGLLGGSQRPPARLLVSEVDGSVVKRDGKATSLRDERYKIIRSTVDGSNALFDLVADPRETADESERVPAVYERLDAALRELERRSAARAAPVAPAERPQEATQERLRALGYVLDE